MKNLKIRQKEKKNGQKKLKEKSKTKIKATVKKKLSDRRKR